METGQKNDHQPWKEGDSVMLANEELVLTGKLRDFGKKFFEEVVLKEDPTMTFEKLEKMTPRKLLNYTRNLSSI